MKRRWGVYALVWMLLMAVSGMSAKATESVEHSEQVLQVLENVNIRQMPTTESRIVGNIPRETELAYIAAWENEKGEVWYEITYQAIDGYITASVVDAGESPMTPQPIALMEEETTQMQETEEMSETEDAFVEQETLEEEVQTETESIPIVMETKEEIETQEQFSVVQIEDRKTNQKMRMPDCFEIGICLGILICILVLIRLIRKIRQVVSHR